MPFGFSVVTTVPSVQDVPLSRRIWAWTQPFSGPVWAVLVSFMVITGASMYLFEGESNSSDFDQAREPYDVLKQMFRGYFTAITTFTTQNAEGFSPVTLPGRVYQISLSFSTILVFACCACAPSQSHPFASLEHEPAPAIGC